MIRSTRLLLLSCSLLLLLAIPASAFLVRPSSIAPSHEEVSAQSHRRHEASVTVIQKHASEEDNVSHESDDALEIVLFGVGDLRVDDHEGLHRALRRDNQVLPLLILDDTSLANIPGVVSHTIDTANMITTAVADLQQSLQKQFGLDLQVVSDADSVLPALMKVVQQYAGSVRVHVQDLGDADNQIGYGPFSQLLKAELPVDSNLEVVPWACHLREAPWKQVDSLPDLYPDFAQKFGELPFEPLAALDRDLEVDGAEVAEKDRQIPTAEELMERMQTLLKLDLEQVKAEVNTGIFQSHWGGLDASTVAESKVLENLETFMSDCNEEDAVWVQHPTYPARGCPRNRRSLEHATFNWMLKGTGEEGQVETNNLLAGEPIIRYLAAPLMLGTVSPRRIWHSSTRSFFQFVSPLKTLVEGREWHKLLAAKNIRTRPEYSSSSLKEGETGYGYWRWHGFLCRYAQTPLKKTDVESTKEGVMLFHGFGASGGQWNKAMKELSDIVSSEENAVDNRMEGLAPDLLGFGQSEKPSLSYSIYVWDSQCTDFVKEVATSKCSWDSYVVGGNSIGGFSAASTAANECVSIDGDSLCSSGSPGTGKCKGVVLMNPAGPIYSEDDIKAKLEAVGEGNKPGTVAQASALGALPPCKPPPRPVARIFGNGLLSYLRPRIQSICVNLYPTNGAAVDDALCTEIERDSLDPGAINVMISGAKLPPPRSMNEMLQSDFGSATSMQSSGVAIPDEASFAGPVLVATGVLDPLNDAKGRGNGLTALREGIEFDPINAGHCPHDELPNDVATSIAKWMTKTVRPMNTANYKSASSPAAL
ncbi:hydrolase, alpha beta fold family protein [Seminavis robusta]|uniref:Hydrolase, alpha beta fold family protein n=1 Tax=Seminavis robusta TaxID=568900 RepID=A0A9N8EF64_9STRA|nr:hydrolase, alpha beta fold family protein [Seminavis robusta]|eukprot:Sro855_g211380.1 hydrolase, alpha beta fold family protein (818) ;mRNA; f:18213-20754